MRNYHPLTHGDWKMDIDNKKLVKIITNYYKFLKKRFSQEFDKYREITKLSMYKEEDFLKHV
jgi:hypothetical protein